MKIAKRIVEGIPSRISDLTAIIDDIFDDDAESEIKKNSRGYIISILNNDGDNLGEIITNPDASSARISLKGFKQEKKEILKAAKELGIELK